MANKTGDQRYRHTRQAHEGCMICGDPEGNGDSLQLQFAVDDAGGVASDFLVTARHQGYCGLLHGGMTSTLLDAAMTHCLFAAGIRALTAELQVRFLAPIALADQLQISARRLSGRRGLHQLEALICREGKPVARASAKFIEVAGL